MKAHKQKKIIVILTFLILVAVQSSEAQESPKSILFDVPYQTALDKVNDRTGSRLILIYIREDLFDLCNLRLVFSQIRKNVFATTDNLEVRVYTDSETLGKMVTYEQGRHGVPDFENSSAGLKESLEYYKRVYPKVKGLVARYQRQKLNNSVEEYIDFTSTKGDDKWVRLKVF